MVEPQAKVDTSRPMPIWLRNTLVALAHLVLFALSFWGAYCLRLDFKIWPFVTVTADTSIEFTRYWGSLRQLILLVVVTKLLVFWYFRMYSSWGRYVGVQDLIETFKASHVSTAIIVLTVLVYSWYMKTQAGEAQNIPGAVFITDWAGTIALVGGVRFGIRIYREGMRPIAAGGLTNVLIVGAGDAGEAVLREMQRLPVERYRVVGFVDDNPNARGARIHGVLVLGDTSQIGKFCERHEVEELVIALPNPTRQLLRRIIEFCKGSKLIFRIVPGVADLIEGRADLTHLREVDINDLLGREEVQLDMESIGHMLTDQVVLISGAGGSIGSEMCRQVLRFQPRLVVLLEQAENALFFIERELRAKFPDTDMRPVVCDVYDADRLKDVFERYKPDVVFHAAAHKHVPLMEQNPCEAIKNNIFGTRNMADMCLQYKVGSMVMISTDKAVNPTSVMGCTKRIAEMYCQWLNTSGRSQGTRFVTVRFGNVLGSNGSVVPIFRRQIAQGGPVTVTHPEMRRYFMTIPEASQLVIQAGAMGKGGEIFVLDMGEPVKIVDLARDMITLSGYRPDVDIKIDFTGIRPGEKLFEELRISGEGILPTHHEKISIWEVRPSTDEQISTAMEALDRMRSVSDRERITQTLREIVPEFRGDNNGN
ncbi:MAG: SDR family NAD(P)-dependent oxidoreductase [Anaerolineaceae bacterium]|nr:SDR family NAD(P)-dependent oxidoreductase [Anaerolineaceae bacterium]